MCERIKKWKPSGLGHLCESQCLPWSPSWIRPTKQGVLRGHGYSALIPAHLLCQCCPIPEARFHTKFRQPLCLEKLLRHPCPRCWGHKLLFHLRFSGCLERHGLAAVEIGVSFVKCPTASYEHLVYSTNMAIGVGRVKLAKSLEVQMVDPTFLVIYDECYRTALDISHQRFQQTGPQWQVGVRKREFLLSLSCPGCVGRK